MVRYLPEKKIHIIPNDDLDMLLTRRAELEEISDAEQVPEGTREIFGRTWKEIILYAFAAMLVFFVLLKLTRRGSRVLLYRIKAYRHSEYYHFKKIKKPLYSKNVMELRKALNNWTLHPDFPLQGLNQLSRLYGSDDLMEMILELQKGLHRGSLNKDFPVKSCFMELAKARKNMLEKKKTQNMEKVDYFNSRLNPIKE